MAKNKVVYFGETLIDLTSDTVTADKLLQGYTAHDKSGAVITGTYEPPQSGGVDIPIFNMEYDQNWELISASCTETYAQCYNRWYNNHDTSAFYHQIWNDGSGGTWVYNCTLTLTTTLQNKIVYTGFITGHPSFDVVYNSDDTIEFADPSSYALNLEVTSNGVYTPPEEYGAYTRVEVNVPTGGTINNQNKTVTPTTSQQTVTADSGYTGLGTVTVNAMPTGTVGTPTATKGTVSNHSVSVTPSVTNSTGYITGSTKTGTAVTVSASELVSGTYSVTGSGTKDVTNYASISVPSGTAGTPTATKGSVSNHSVSVTPSVTNTAGYITGGTKTGTAVTVSASELVSGSQTLTTNGTTDVTNLASVTVNIPIVTYYTGSSTPSSSLGQNGDIYLKVVG